MSFIYCNTVDLADEFVMANGNMADSPAEFGNSWQQAQADKTVCRL